MRSEPVSLKMELDRLYNLSTFVTKKLNRAEKIAFRMLYETKKFNRKLQFKRQKRRVTASAGDPLSLGTSRCISSCCVHVALSVPLRRGAQSCSTWWISQDHVFIPDNGMLADE